MKIKVPILALSAFFLLSATSSADTEWIIELQKSDDLNSWNVFSMEAEILQDGRLRVVGAEPSGFFRIHLRTPEDVATDKALAYINAEGINVPVPTVQDYQDLSAGAVDPGDLAELNAHLLEFQGERDELSAYIEAKIVLLSMDPDAVDYAQRTGLANEQQVRLSSFLLEIKSAGFSPSWLVLGKPDFKALNGSNHLAVVGDPASLTGYFSESTDGLVFAASGEVYEFPNPSQSAAISELSMIANMKTGTFQSAIRGAISGYYGNTAGVNHGPSLTWGEAIGSGQNDYRKMGANARNATAEINMGSAGYSAVVPGLWNMIGFYWSEFGVRPSKDVIDRPLSMSTRLMLSTTAPKDLEPLWNNTPSLRVGNTGTGASPFDGEFDFGMICPHAVTETMLHDLLEAGRKHGVMNISNTNVIYGVGDSMTVGNTFPVAAIQARSEQLVLQESAWQGAYIGHKAKSGQPIEVQEGFYAEAKALLQRVPSWNRWVMFWGGYNISSEDYANEASRNAILQRYLDMAEDAAQNGINTIHWSVLVGQSGDLAAEIADWNLEYENGLAALRALYPAVQLLWYDHRLSFSEGQLDGRTRNEAYFVDSRHLSAAGQAVMVRDYNIRCPQPDGSTYDSDAANYMGQLIASGVELSLSERTAINDWYLAEKAAGTYSSLTHLYLPIWGQENANSVNLISSEKGSFYDDVIHGEGYVVSDMDGTPGYFDFEESPLAMGMTNASMWYCSLLLDGGLSASQSLIGARTNASVQNRIQTDSLNDLRLQVGAVGDCNYITYSSQKGFYSGSRTDSEQFLTIRSSAGRTKVASNATAPAGSVSDLAIYALCSNNEGAPGGHYGKQTGLYGAGLGITDAQDEARTARLKTLWEQLTGLTLPNNP